MASTGEALRGRSDNTHRSQQTRVASLVPALLTLLPVTLVLLTVRRGVGFSPDSFAYASTRQELIENGRWAFPSLWPIGYPLIVVAVGTGAGAVALAVGSLLAYLTACFRLAVEAVESWRAGLLVFGWVAVSLPTVWVWSMLWSETVFCIATAGIFWALVRVQKARQLGRGPVVALVGCLVAAGVLRFAALPFPPAVGLVVALVLVPQEGIRGLAKAVGVAAAGSIGLAFSFGRNLLVGVDPAGPRSTSLFSPAEVATQVPYALSTYVYNMPVVSLTVGLVSMLPLAAVLVAWLARERSAVLDSPVMPLLVLTVAYVAFCLLSAATTIVDPLNYRLLAPVQAPIAIMLTMAARSLWRGERARRVGMYAACVYIAGVATTTVLWVTAD